MVQYVTMNLKRAATYILGWPFSILALFFLFYIIVSQNISFSSEIGRISLPVFFISMVLLVSYFFTRTTVWCLILRQKEISIPYSKASYIWSISELKRFVPGNIWSFLGKGLLLSKEGMGKKEILHTFLIEVEFFIVAAFFLSSWSFPFLIQYVFKEGSTGESLASTLQIVAGLTTFFFLIHKPISKIIPEKISSRISFLFPNFPVKDTCVIFLFTLLCLFFFGLGTYFAIISITYLSPVMLTSFITFFIFSLLSGYLTLITPMGLGVREGIITAGLSPFLGLGLAAFVSVFARITLIISEFTFLSFLIFWNKSKRVQKGMEFISGKRYETILVASIFIFVTYFIVAGFLRHQNFYTGRFDLGNMDQTVWNSAHGRIFEFTNPDGTEIISRLAYHSDFILILLAPFYFIWEDPRMLILIQAVVVGLGAIFIYLISLFLLKKRSVSLILAVSFLINPIVLFPLLYDFHAVVLATTFLLGAFYFILKRKYLLFFIFAVLAGATKEQVWITCALLAVYLGVTNKKRFLAGISLSALFFTTFYFIFWKAIPAARGGQDHFALQLVSEIGSTPAQILKTLIFFPDKWIHIVFESSSITYLRALFVQTGYISILGFPFLIFAAPDLLINLLSTSPSFKQIYFQYNAVIIPFIFIATIYGIKFTLYRFAFTKYTYINLFLIICALYGAYYYGPLPGSRRPNIDMFTKQIKSSKEIGKYLQQLEPSYKVASSNNVGAHLSHRRYIYTIPFGLSEADVLVFFLKNNGFEKPSPEAQKEMVKKLRKNKNYVVDLETNDFISFLKVKNDIISDL